MIDAIKAAITEAMQILQDAGVMVKGRFRVFLRTVSSTGGDTLLGLKGTETVTDAEVLPSPLVVNVNERVIAFSNGRLKFGDLKVTFPPDMAIATIEAADAIIVDTTPYRVIQFDWSDMWLNCIIRRVVEP